MDAKRKPHLHCVPAQTCPGVRCQGVSVGTFFLITDIV